MEGKGEPRISGVLIDHVWVLMKPADWVSGRRLDVNSNKSLRDFKVSYSTTLITSATLEYASRHVFLSIGVNIGGKSFDLSYQKLTTLFTTKSKT